MRSRHTHWHDSLNCAVLPDITGTTPATNLDTSKWKFLTDIKLVHDTFNIPGDIDLLLRADLFYEILESGRRTSPNLPVLQKKVLGWTLAKFQLLRPND